MAEQGRREVVGDPLALNPAAQAPDRSLSTMMVRNPGQSGGKLDNSIGDSLSSLGNAIAGVMQSKEDDWMAEGKLQYMQGATEEQIAKTGNKWTMQGWQALNAADKANRWYAEELNMISNGANTMDPLEYNKGLMQRRAAFLENLPEDPAIRKLYVNAFDELGPRLTAAQTTAQNEYNKQQSVVNFGNLLSSGSFTNADSPVNDGSAPLAISQGRVRPVVEGYAPEDVDLMTRAVLGEAAGEGATGQAAVAHNILNRVIDGSFGGRSIKGVVLKPGAYSALNGETGYIGGEGSNKLVNMDPNSAEYQRTRQIVETVLTGHHVDPTNGSTHYVSGGVRPNWFSSEEAKSGGIVRIGGHEFVGKARNLGNAASPTSGNLKFMNPGQEGIQPGFATVLQNTGTQLGIDLTITSGYRDPNHKVEAAKGNGGGTHTHGQAADIDMTGMDDEQRANLVRTLKANGARRFGTYDNHPNMLHVDMSEKNGAQWFMHNKSNKNLAGAPEWFKQVSAEPVQAGGTNIAVTGDSAPQAVQDATAIANSQTVSIAQTQTQEMIRGYNMPAADKATAVAQELMTQLSGGSTALWDNVGGSAFLRELGATPVEIRQVENAYEAYQKESANKFDMGRAKWEAELTSKITTGEITVAEAEAQIQERYNSGGLRDEQAYSLVAKVNAAGVAEGRMPNMEPAVQRRLADVYAAVRRDPTTYTAEWADDKIRAIADHYGMPPAQLQQRLAEAWQTEESSKSTLRQQVATAEQKRVQRQSKIDEVKTVLRSGQGLDSVSGEIDGMPAKQWAIQYRMQELRTVAAEAIPDYIKSGMTQMEAMHKASAVAEELGWREFQAQGGVVDDELAGAVTAGASGVVISAGGKVDESARNALDTWLRLNQVDRTGSYAARYAKTDESRNLLMLAQKYHDGGFDLDSALRKAGEFLSTGLTDPPDITKTTDFTRKLNTAMKDNFDGLMGAPGWFDTAKISLGEKRYAMNNEGANLQLQQAIRDKAWALYAAEPQNDPDIIMKKAAQDVIRDSVIIGGNVLTARSSGGTPIMEQMGLRWTDASGKQQSYPQDAANEAVQMWVKKFAEEQISNAEAGVGDPTGWGRQYKERRGGKGVFRGNNGNPTLFRDEPEVPIYATWDQTSGTLAIQMWDTPERKGTVPVAKAKTLYVPLSDIGEYYRKQKETTGASVIQDAWKSIWGGTTE